jgi:hypothetical protein
VNLFDEFVHDSRAWFKPFGTDDTEWAMRRREEAEARRRRLKKRLAEFEQRDAKEKELEISHPKELKRGGIFSEVALSAEERVLLNKYREDIKKPVLGTLQKEGREPFDLGGGYMRLRRVYYGFDQDAAALEHDRLVVAAIVPEGQNKQVA